jgi:hypothetical protein
MTPMTPTEDIRLARHKLAEQFGNDLDRIVADLRRQQLEAGGEYISRPPRRPSRAVTTNKPLHPSGEIRCVDDGESSIAAG